MSDSTPPPAPEPVDPPAPTPVDENVESLPQWARDSLTKANKEAAEYRTRLREAEPALTELAALKAASQTELEKAQELAAANAAAKQEAEATLAAERAERLRLKVAMDKQLPASLVDRLRGSTEEELAADADALLALLPTPSRPPAPNPAQGTSGAGAPGYADRIAEASKAGNHALAIALKQEAYEATKSH